MSQSKDKKTSHLQQLSVSPIEKIFWWAGHVGSSFFSWLKRIRAQIAFLGRLVIIYYQYHNKARGFFIRQTLANIYQCGIGCLLIVSFLGFITGYLWGSVWFKQLANIAGLNNLAVLFLKGQLNETAVIATMVVVIFKCCSSITLEIATMRASGQMQTIRLLGISPEYCIALPKLLGTFIAFVTLVIFFIFFTISGVALTVWRFSLLLPQEFFSAVAQVADYSDFLIILLKSVLVGLIIPTISIYNGWQQKRNMWVDIPPMLSRSLVECLVYGAVACVLITIKVNI